MKKMVTFVAGALLIGGLFATPASAKKRHRHIQSPSKLTTGAVPMQRGNNAELMIQLVQVK